MNVRNIMITPFFNTIKSRWCQKGIASRFFMCKTYPIFELYVNENFINLFTFQYSYSVLERRLCFAAALKVIVSERQKALEFRSSASLLHIICIRTVSSLLLFEQVFGLFGQSNMYCSLNFCPHQLKQIAVKVSQSKLGHSKIAHCSKMALIGIGRLYL